MTLGVVVNGFVGSILSDWKLVIGLAEGWRMMSGWQGE